MTEGAVYLETFRIGELSRRVEQGLELLRSCRVCPSRLRCRSPRRRESGVPHRPPRGCGEPLRSLRRRGLPARIARLGTIFFANCNLKCVFCQNFDISQRPAGTVTPPHRLAEMMLELQGQGCHNINFVTPEHVVPQVLEALPIAIKGGLRVPLVYNTSGYDSLESLRAAGRRGGRLHARLQVLGLGVGSSLCEGRELPSIGTGGFKRNASPSRRSCDWMTTVWHVAVSS